MIRWRGRPWWRPDQVANAHDRTVDLTPASGLPAEQTRANWSAFLPGQEIPLIWERVYDSQKERERDERRWDRGTVDDAC